MFNFMKKIPGGLLLIPMLVSALVYTFFPGIFNIGGVTQEFFTEDGLNYIIGALVFFSGAALDISHLGKILKKQGSLLLVKTIICIGLGYLYFQAFGPEGLWGVSAMAFVTVLTSTNPSLYLALVNDYGDQDDVAAFGFIGLACVPAYPMFVYGISQATPVDWMPIISTLIPFIVGIVIGNLDKNMAKLFTPAIQPLLPLTGWVFGANINLVSAFTSGLLGLVLAVIFYIVIMLPLYLFEKGVLKKDGISAVAMSTVAGMSVSVPSLMAAANPSLAPFAEAATAQIAFGVVLTSVVTPIIARKLFNKEYPNKLPRTQRFDEESAAEGNAELES